MELNFKWDPRLSSNSKGKVQQAIRDLDLMAKVVERDPGTRRADTREVHIQCSSLGKDLRDFNRIQRHREEIARDSQKEAQRDNS